ncbi:hypothetical protein JHK85_040924 [Glycine max]|nr:hypothetical protein JHK85_040924 [Glycine max]
MNNRSFGQYARVLVDIDSKHELRDQILVVRENRKEEVLEKATMVPQELS